MQNVGANLCSTSNAFQKAPLNVSLDRTFDIVSEGYALTAEIDGQQQSIILNLGVKVAAIYARI